MTEFLYGVEFDVRPTVNGSSLALLSETRSIYLPPHNFSGTLTNKTGTGRVPIFDAGKLDQIRAMVGTAPVGASVTVTIKKNGATTIATVTFAVAATSVFLQLDDTNHPNRPLAAGDYLTCDVNVGTATATADLVVSYEEVLN